MNNDADLLASLKAIANGSAQLKAFERALLQLVQAVTDAMAKVSEPKEEAKHEGPDMQALVSALVEAVRNIQPPQVTVTPAMPTTTGAAWEVEGKGPGGHPFKMKITKL